MMGAVGDLHHPGSVQYLDSVDAVPGSINRLTLEARVLDFLGETGKTAVRTSSPARRRMGSGLGRS